ncbi:MAG: MATE family efflux transporter [Eubacteriales bacterium]|nr:MATE family efflux transporter [Eubacteriales bacterium]
MQISNCESVDLSNLLYEALNNLDYSSERINNYVLLIEEALMKWREELNGESELTFTRRDRGNDAVFEFSVKDRRCDPFAKDKIINFEKPIRTMYDRLLSGIGSELRYSYRKGVNKLTLRLPKTDIRDTLFRRTAMASFVPFSFQYLIIGIATNIGVLILGFFSSDAMSGVSFASQIVMIHTVLISAATGAVNSILSQFWGRRNGSSAVYAMYVAVAFSTLICIPEFIACFFFPGQLMGLYTNIPELIKEGAAYLKIASVSFLFNSFCNIFYAFLRITDQGRTVTKIVALSCALNVVLNLLLVFGLFGLPEMGAVGSGIALTSAVVLQFILCLACYIKIKPSFFNPDDEINREHITKVFFKNALPIFLQHGVYLVGINFVAAAIGRIDADVIAAFSFVNAVNTHLLCTKNACADTAGILAGLQLGKNRFEDAIYEHRLLNRLASKISVAVMAALFVIVFALQLFPLKLSDAAKQYLFPITLIFALNNVFGIQNSVNNSALYAGGETRPIFYIDAVNSLLLCVPISLISVKLNCFAPVLLVLLSKMDEIVTFLPKMLNIKRGKWLRNIVE